MTKKLMDKVMGFIGFDDEYVEDESWAGEGAPREEDPGYDNPRKKGQVVKLHSQRQVKVVVTSPREFEEVQGIAENLKNRSPVVINLEQADAEMAQRVIDFISGAAYALDGSMQKVGGGIFLCVPSNMDISSELREQLKDKYTFDWVK